MTPALERRERRLLRAQVLDRAARACERCGRKDGQVVETVWDGSGRWRNLGALSHCWRDRDGVFLAESEPPKAPPHKVRTFLCVVPRRYGPGGKRANASPSDWIVLCQGCRLHHDQPRLRKAQAEARRRRWEATRLQPHQLPLPLETPYVCS